MFAGASPDTKREIIETFLEELIWIPSDTKGRTGNYNLYNPTPPVPSTVASGESNFLPINIRPLRR